MRASRSLARCCDTAAGVLSTAVPSVHRQLATAQGQDDRTRVGVGQHREHLDGQLDELGVDQTVHHNRRSRIYVHTQIL